MPQSLAKINIHLIFSTKGRTHLLKEGIRESLHAYCATVVNACGCRHVVMNSVEDHAYLLFDLGRTVTVSKVVEQVKSASSRWIKTQSQAYQGFTWQGGYAALGVDPKNMEAIRQYILNQCEHHRHESFQEEVRRFLTEYGIPFDERYVWD